ncbi:MAG: thioredoxin [Planctomycetota bacterium]
MAGNIIQVTDETFDEVCLRSDIPVLVDFWAPWCGPCRALAPTLEKLADEFKGKVKICKHNTDDDPNTAVKFGVSAIPTLLFMKGGKEVHREVGASKSANDLRRIITEKCGV